VSRHRTDVVAFVFATCFLVCAGLAIGVRTGNLGLGTSAPDGAWIAGTVLAVAGVIGVVGTLSSLRRDRQPVATLAPSTVTAQDTVPDEHDATEEDDTTDVLDDAFLNEAPDVLDEAEPDEAEPDRGWS
jgi:hypothetical protein